MIGTKPSAVEDSFCFWEYLENILNVGDVISPHLNTPSKHLSLQPAQMSRNKNEVNTSQA
jgi:hypothetical protein